MTGRTQRATSTPGIGRLLLGVMAVLAVLVSILGPSYDADAAQPPASVDVLSAAPVDAADTRIVPTTLVGFDPGNIISDAVFTNKSTMTEAQIQAFFNGKVSTCRGGSDSYGPIVCLKDFKMDTVTRPADTYCSGYTGAANESAARIIYRVSQSCGINPQVLIVMLQKEQGLVTHTWPSAWRYDKALGQACPDTAPCDPKFIGFFHQVYGAARQMQIYMEGKHFTWYKAGQTWNIRYNPSVSCGSSPVYIANKATEALYYYTPYQPNAAALAAGYGVGDSCSAYGNRNFYNYFTDWFGSTGAGDLCVVPSTVVSMSGKYVTTSAALNARKAPSTGCQADVFTLPAGTIMDARRTTADGTWVEVLTLDGLRWVSRDFLREADAAEALCALPSGTSKIEGEYVVHTATPAKIAPWAACDLQSSALSVGTVLQATRISYTGNWLEVQTEAGPRWVAHSAVEEYVPAGGGDTCADPASTSAASGDYVVRVAGMAWVSPLAKCTEGEQVSEGTVLQATRLSYTGLWLEVQTQAGLRWVARDSVDVATAGDMEAACVAPAATAVLHGQFVLRNATMAWSSPLVKCGVGHELSAGTTLQATRLSYSGLWLLVQTQAGPRWVLRSAVEEATSADIAAVCVEPAATSEMSGQYVLRETAMGWVSPLDRCGVGEQIQVDTVVQATRLSHSGLWLQVHTQTGLRWVSRSAMEEATTADSAAVCVDPAATSRVSGLYAVRTAGMAWISPLEKCGVGEQLSGGLVVQATQLSYSGKWLEVRTSAGTGWVSRDAVAECAEPAGTRKSSARYVLREAAEALVSPLAECGTAASAWGEGAAPRAVGAGTVVQATRISYTGNWVEIETAAGPRWVRNDAVAVCVDPAGTRATTMRYVVEVSTQALVSPLAECGTAAKHWGTGTAPKALGVGTVVQATRISHSGNWLEIVTDSGPRWIWRADVRER